MNKRPEIKWRVWVAELIAADGSCVGVVRNQGFMR